MRHAKHLALSCAVLICGCSGDRSPDEHIPEAGPPPVSGGTLHVSEDGALAIVSDPARASIFVVDLEAGEERHRVVLGPEDEPGRIAIDPAGRVHVVLRRAGQLLTLNADSGEVTDRRDVCRAPRGIDVDPDSGELVVACAEGYLVRLPAEGGSPTGRVKLVPDLRDVVARSGSQLLVSVFRSAEVLVVEDGLAVRTMRPQEITQSGFTAERRLVPTVAWRLRAHPDGAIMAHQHSVATQLGTLGVFSGMYYGGDCDTGVVRSAVTVFDVDAETTRGLAVDGASLVVDVDRGPDRMVLLAAAAEPGTPSDRPRFQPLSGVRTARASDMQLTPRCTTSADPLDRPVPAVAVAATPQGYVAQYRDPARLVVHHGRGTEPTEIALSGGRVEHLGHALFHEAVGTGATCASCHPEGGDDGHVWQFDVGARRTQTMRGGILQTAPFHWTGDVTDVTSVMDGTFVGRMGAAMPRADEIESFEQWVDALPATPAPPAQDPAAVDRGRALFERPDVGCASCHAGERGTNNETVPADTGGRFQVPALYEVVYHAPYLHDGSAAGLDELLTMHGDAAALTEAERGDLAAYLRSR